MSNHPIAEIAEFVRLGQRVCNDFAVELHDRDVLEAVMASAERVNDFDPHEVARTIGTVFDNASSVTFGILGYPVLYIGIPFFTDQRIAAPDGPGDQYTDEQRRDVTRHVIAWARAVHADQISVQQSAFSAEEVEGEPGEHPYCVRIHWT